MTKTKHKIIVQSRINFKHDFTASERNDIVAKMTGAYQEKVNLEAQFKSVSADYKARIKTAESVMGECNTKLVNGYEHRPLDVATQLNRKTGLKRHHERVPGKPQKLGKFLSEDKMTEADFNLLPLPELPPENQPDLPKAKKRKLKKGEAKEIEDQIKKNQVEGPNEK